MDFPIDFIFRRCTFLNEALDNKNFERSYADKSQFLADLATKTKSPGKCSNLSLAELSLDQTFENFRLALFSLSKNRKSETFDGKSADFEH